MLRKLGSKKQQGFTLIELMIVIAIIGILAAIAIPQFVKYRIQSFNSSGLSDGRNLFTSQEAFFADWRVYGGSNWTAVANPPVWALFAGGQAPNVLLGPAGNPAGGAFIPGIEATDRNGRAQGTQIPLGNGVSMVANTNAAAAGVLANQSFTMASKHVSGDTYYAVDSDTTGVYFCQIANSEGTQVVATDAPVAVISVDQFNGQNGPDGATPWDIR